MGSLSLLYLETIIILIMKYDGLITQYDHLQMNELEIVLPYSWTHGSCGYHANHLYLINGLNCSSTSCNIFTKNLQYSLDISNIIISPNNSRCIQFSSQNINWIQSTISSPPLSHALGSQSSGSIYFNDKIYINHPNYEYNNYSLQYSMNNNQYLSLDEYSWDISGCILMRDACTTHNTTDIFTIGGQGINGSLPRCDVYNIDTDSWRQINNLNVARHNAGCTTLNDTVYVLGGQNKYMQGKKLDSIEAYDIYEDEWILFNITLNAKRAGHACITHINQQWILCFGGFSFERIEIFDPYSMIVINTTMFYEGFAFGHVLYPINEYQSVLFLMGGGNDISEPMEYMNTIKYIVMSMDDEQPIFTNTIQPAVPLTSPAMIETEDESSNIDTTTIPIEISDIFKMYILYNQSNYKSGIMNVEDDKWIHNNTLDTFIQITETFDYNAGKLNGDIINLTFCIQYNVLYDDIYCNHQDLEEYSPIEEHAKYLAVAHFTLSSNQIEEFAEYTVNILEGFIFRDMLTAKMKSNNITSTFDTIIIYVQSSYEEVIIPPLNTGGVSLFTIIYLIIGIIGFCILSCIALCCICSCAQRSATTEAQRNPDIINMEVEMTPSENFWSKTLSVWSNGTGSSNEKQRVHRITTTPTQTQSTDNNQIKNENKSKFMEVNEDSDADSTDIEERNQSRTEQSKSY